MSSKAPLRVFPLANISREVCFINVVVQSMRYLAEISRRIFFYNGTSDADSEQLARTDIAYDKVMTELRKIFRREISDVEALRHIDNFLPQQMRHGHQDSLEFLDILLSKYLVDEKTLFEFTEATYYYCGNCYMVCLILLHLIPITTS
jgi:hypothetical protein